MMKMLVLTICLFLCGCVEAPRKHQEEWFVTKEPHFFYKDIADKWSGFRGLKWNTNIRDMNDPNMVLIYENTKRRVSYYERQDDKLSIGKADLSDLIYMCYKDRFFGVFIMVEGMSNFQYLKDAVFAHYGEGHKLDVLEDKWLWNSAIGAGVSNVTMTLKYDNIIKQAWLRIYYRPILYEQKADNAKAATEAKSDF